jgi:hypothetical protein
MTQDKCTAKELAAKNIVEGIFVKDWVNKPYGSFAQAVRRSGVDPSFGLREGEDKELKKFSVCIKYTYAEYAHATYTVEATDKEAAEKKAYGVFCEDATLPVNAEFEQITEIKEE